MAAVAGLQSKRVITSLTIGRADGSPFRVRNSSCSKRSGPWSRSPSRDRSSAASRAGAARDPLTGLYTRAYLEARLEQMLALRRRTAADSATAAVDDDGRHGPPRADQ